MNCACYINHSIRVTALGTRIQEWRMPCRLLMLYTHTLIHQMIILINNRLEFLSQMSHFHYSIMYLRHVIYIFILRLIMQWFINDAGSNNYLSTE